ncbi:MAG: STAS domain-containing protein [Phycisphaerales bacterium]|nr:STAS domain-containing protein [Phycisphaerales bacterium]
MSSLMQRLDADQDEIPDMIVNLSSVTYLNSSNIAQLLRLRKKLNTAGRNMRICAVEDQVWGVLMITGLDKIFDFTDDVTTALASLQLTD